MPLLSVNIDFVAAMRELQHREEPEPAQAAVLIELAGADGITIQVRRDRKSVRDRDLYLLKGLVKSKLTLQMPIVDEIIERALEVKPDQVTLVADHVDSHSLMTPIDFGAAPVDYSDISSRFTGLGNAVCYFVEPETDQVKSAARHGATSILLNCNAYGSARTVAEAQTELDRIDRAAQAAVKANLNVQCGRSLNYSNIAPLVELGNIEEFAVGHAICARAMLVGFDRAVRDMLSLIRK